MFEDIATHACNAHPAAVAPAIKKLPTRPAIPPEKAQNKVYKALAVLDALQPGDAVTASQISEWSGLSVKDLGKIMTRLSVACRVSRHKEESGPDSYFRYWLNPVQRKQFRAQVRGAKAASALQVPTYGDAQLDALAELGVRLLTSRRDIEMEKLRLNERLELVRAQLQDGLSEMDDLKAQMRSDEREVAKVKRDLRKQRERAGKVLRERGDQRVAAPKDVPTRMPANPLIGAQPDPVELSARLNFLRQLRARPALADLALLAKIEADYERALKLVLAAQE